jgi:Bacterial EndoU nuclease
MSGAHEEDPSGLVGAVLTNSRRTYILDGDGKGGGGHGPGRGIPGKSEFPADWSDDRVIDAVRSVADDPAAVREATTAGRAIVTGVRDMVEIRVVIGRDGRTIVTAYPWNAPRNPQAWSN